MKKVVLEKINSANIKVTNSTDYDKVYDIQANLAVSGTVINNVQDGVVTLSETRKANFYRYDENNLNIQFLTTDETEMCSIVAAVNAFINNCVQAVTNNEFNV